MFNKFFELSPVDYVKYLINLKNTEEKKNCHWGKKQNIRFKDRIKKWAKEKKKNADEALKIIEEILDYNERAQTFFPVALEVDKEKSKPIPEESITKRVKLRREKITKIEDGEKNISNVWFKEYFTI